MSYTYLLEDEKTHKSLKLSKFLKDSLEIEIGNTKTGEVYSSFVMTKDKLLSTINNILRLD
jgi:hypothetical protein